MNQILCVFGPTASGKTRLAVALAKRYDGEVLSCDSMQLYRGMEIGTATPTAEEMAGVPHHMIDCVDPAEPFSVGRYVALADPILQDILRRGKTAVLAGGTGLYADSLLAGRTFSPMPETGKREELERQLREHGVAPLLSLLREHDPESANRLHPADHKRILRAAEVFLETGKPISQHNRETQAQPPKYRPFRLGLNFQNRQDLYDRIDRRVDRMVDIGLFDEVARLLDSGVPETATAMQAIGYKEAAEALRGTLSREEAVARIKQESRRYAKRQLTWFRKNPDIHWLTLPREPDFSAVLAEACRLCENS
ncbi:MAG: tRNA (adenosine(37)-N6)-dimethylallyltransferase MiaA [Oscillospiraceae bacterium]|nr:tRNA (adenosine(37)-N6)-dimethylallyltransferase MiaA [Oscillospiraceae bacterium]